MSNDNTEQLIIWEAPKIVAPEPRLYYDDEGKVLFYTCDKPEGNYIVIDNLTFAEARYDVIVSNGKIIKPHKTTHSYNLVPSKDGQKCVYEDVSIIADNYDDKTITWNWKQTTT